MSLGEITNSREFLAPSTEIDDESCSYNEEEQDLEDRSDATYDVEYPFEVQPQAEVGHKMNPERKEMGPSSEQKEEQSDFLQPQGLPKAESCNSLPTPEDVDPDSLVANSSGEDDDKMKLGECAETDFEPECDFKDKECQFSVTSQSVCPSRASVDSQRSVCFFVDLEDDSSFTPTHSVVANPSRRFAKPYRTQSQSDRMTQSMYVETNTPRRCPSGASVSFYVDLNNSSSLSSSRTSMLLRSESREESGKDLEEVSEDMQVKSQLLMEKSLQKTQAFFGKLKDYIDYLGKPSYSKEELRKKRQMAENITRLMFEEEENIRSGRLLSETQILDQFVLKGPEKPTQKSVTKNLLEAPSTTRSDEKPVLRRERTFDMDPKMSLRQMSIPIDSPTTSDQSSETTQICNVTLHGTGNKEDGKSAADPVSGLEMFQQQRLIHTQKLKMEILKLEKMEQKIATSNHKNVKSQTNNANCPKPKMRQCWGDKNSDKPDKLTSFKDLNKTTRSSKPNDGRPISASSVSSSCSWFVPSDELPPERPAPQERVGAKRREASKGIQTGDSLLRQFRERHDKGVYVRERPQAYFLACEEQVLVGETEVEKRDQPVAKPRTVGIVRSYRARDELPLVKTTVIDLETEVLPEENNLQEALRRRRPDYIARCQDRDRDRMVRSLVSNQRKLANEDLMTRSTTSITQSGRQVSNRIPLSISPYLSKNVISKPATQRSQNPSSVKEPPKPADRPTSTSSNTSKSRIPRTTAAGAVVTQQSRVSKASEVYQPESGCRNGSYGSSVARLHEPLQLRGPNTATVYSTNAQDVKQKRRYISNRVA